MAIYVTGDTHSNWMRRLRMASFPEQRKLTKNDYVIICGDFGLWQDTDEERFLLDWLDNRSFTTLFVSGNHENYDRLDAMPIEEWHGAKVNFIRPSVIHLRRGQIVDLDGAKFFTFGGASSHDVSDGILDLDDPDFYEKRRELDQNPFAMYRVNHLSWWKQELPTEDEMQEGLKNLAEQNNKVDFIITHSPCNTLLNAISIDIGLAEGEYSTDHLTDYLESIRNLVDYRYWYFGHMHFNLDYPSYNSACLYEQIIRIL